MAAMKTIRVVKLFYLALVIFALFPILAMPKPAHAATVGVYFTNVTGTVCTNNSISGTWRETADIPGPGYVYDYDVLIEKNGVIVATYVWYNDRPVGPTAGPTTVGSWGSVFGYAAQTQPYIVRERLTTYLNGVLVLTSEWTMVCNGGIATVLSVVTFAPAQPTANYFNPNDDRVDPRPGDRLAVYCNQSDKVVVYGIADDLPPNKSGFHLATFSYKAILAAGPKGLTRSAGAMGSVSVSIIDGWYWIAWNGGKYNATGQGIFVKNFDDAKWCSRAHQAQ